MRGRFFVAGSKELRDIDSYIRYLLDNAPKGIHGTQRAEVLRELFQTYFGIYNHINPAVKNALAPLLLHETITPEYEYSVKKTAIMYAQKSIKECFDISLIEFLNLPITVTEELLEAADVVREDKLKALNGMGL